MTIARAEYNSLLLRPSGLKKIVEKVLTHGKNAVGEQDAVFVLGFFVTVFQLLPCYELTGYGINRVTLQNFLNSYTRLVKVNTAFLDFARGKVTVLNGLGHIVFINRLTEIFDIVSRDSRIFFGFSGFFHYFKLPRRGGKTDMDAFAVAS